MARYQASVDAQTRRRRAASQWMEQGHQCRTSDTAYRCQCQDLGRDPSRHPPGAMSMFLPSPMLNIMHCVRPLRAVGASNVGALIGGAIIDQDQLPFTVRLTTDALNRLVEKHLRVQEGIATDTSGRRIKSSGKPGRPGSISPDSWKPEGRW